jgi:hypothetical protein
MLETTDERWLTWMSPNLQEQVRMGN